MAACPVMRPVRLAAAHFGLPEVGDTLGASCVAYLLDGMPAAGFRLTRSGTWAGRARSVNGGSVSWKPVLSAGMATSCHCRRVGRCPFPFGTIAAMEHRLAGVVEKFNRSRAQLDELRGEIDAWFGADPPPYSSVGGFDFVAYEWVERFHVHREPPLRLGVILGDCLHNLRSALDHLAWQVTLLDGGTPDGDTQFPIVSKSEVQFEKTADRRIPGLNARHRAMVKSAQPFHDGAGASSHPLSVLADLSNIDKHRVVHPAFSMVAYDVSETLDRLVEDDAKHGADTPVAGWFIASRGKLEQDTPWFRIVWRKDAEPPQSVHLSGTIPTDVGFGDIGIPISEFKKIPEAVRAVMEAFLAEFPETRCTDES
jgi:hypothetical protein